MATEPGVHAYRSIYSQDRFWLASLLYGPDAVLSWFCYHHLSLQLGTEQAAVGTYQRPEQEMLGCGILSNAWGCRCSASGTTAVPIALERPVFKSLLLLLGALFPVISMELLPWVVMGPLVPIFIVKLSSVWFQWFFLTLHAFPGPEELDLSRPVLHHPVHASLWVCTCLQFIKVSFKWIGRCERQKLFSTFWIIGGVSGT